MCTILCRRVFGWLCCSSDYKRSWLQNQYGNTPYKNIICTKVCWRAVFVMFMCIFIIYRVLSIIQTHNTSLTTALLLKNNHNNTILFLINKNGIMRFNTLASDMSLHRLVLTEKFLTCTTTGSCVIFTKGEYPIISTDVYWNLSSRRHASASKQRRVLCLLIKLLTLTQHNNYSANGLQHFRPCC
jgi:hypothetical protein